jgi:UDP-glucose 4-epimerase
VRDYIYIEDISRLITRVLSSPNPNDTFNIGTGRGHSSLEVISLIRDRFALPEIPIVFGSRRSTDVVCSFLNMDKFAKNYGMGCDISLEEGLQRYAELEARGG